ncbi:MAG: hypothetical protein ACJAS1_002001 [Oleiphilaceae bacterium]|jgi:hypothetical protein
MNFKCCFTLLGLFLVLVKTPQLMAVDNFPDSRNHQHHDIVGKGQQQNNRSGIYTCDLLTHSNQCREYEVLEGAKTTLSDIKDGCESMSGSFSKHACSGQKVLSSCKDIIRNYHQPDVIYSNYYYIGSPSNWTFESTKRVCSDLGGEFLSE